MQGIPYTSMAGHTYCVMGGGPYGELNMIHDVSPEKARMTFATKNAKEMTGMATSPPTNLEESGAAVEYASLGSIQVDPVILPSKTRG